MCEFSTTTLYDPLDIRMPWDLLQLQWLLVCFTRTQCSKPEEHAVQFLSLNSPILFFSPSLPLALLPPPSSPLPPLSSLPLPLPPICCRLSALDPEVLQCSSASAAASATWYSNSRWHWTAQGAKHIKYSNTFLPQNTRRCESIPATLRYTLK